MAIFSVRMICRACCFSVVRKVVSSDRILSQSCSLRRLSTNPSLVGQLSSSTFLSPQPTLALEIAQRTAVNDLGLTWYWPTDLVVHGIELLHNNVGVPYCFSIISGAVVMRFLLWYSEIVKRRFFNTMGERMTIKQEIDYELDCAKYEHRRARADQLFLESNYHRMRLLKDVRTVGIHFVFQSLGFITMTRGLRKCNEMLPGFHTGGLPWSPDLALADTTLFLPIITSATVFSSFMVSKLIASNPLLLSRTGNRWTAKEMTFLGVFCGAAGLISYSGIASSSLNIYVLSAMFVSVVQNSVLNIPAVKEASKIPDVINPRQPSFLAHSQDGAEGTTTEKSPRKGFRESIKNRFSAMQKTVGYSARKQQRIDTEKNQRQEYLNKWNAAGTGPIPVTYEYNPLLKT